MRKWHRECCETPQIVYIKCMEGNTPDHTLNPLKSSLMRKIEQQMLTAIRNNDNWQSANTSVHYNEENDVSIVRLHGNKIAEVGDDFVTIFDGGWQTNTTKSRLNVIINEFCNGLTDGVFQKNFKWFISDNKVIRDFESGYIFA